MFWIVSVQSKRNLALGNYGELSFPTIRMVFLLFCASCAGVSCQNGSMIAIRCQILSIKENLVKI